MLPRPGTFPKRLPVKVDGTIVYKAYDADGEVLYVGISDSLYGRLVEHQRGSAWWAEADHLELEQYPTRHQAMVRERELVRRLEPPYNVLLHGPARRRITEDEPTNVYRGQRTRTPWESDLGPHTLTREQYYRDVV